MWPCSTVFAPVYARKVVYSCLRNHEHKRQVQLLSDSSRRARSDLQSMGLDTAPSKSKRK